MAIKKRRVSRVPSLPKWRVVLLRQVEEKIITDAIDLVCGSCGLQVRWRVSEALPSHRCDNTADRS